MLNALPKKEHDYFALSKKHQGSSSDLILIHILQLKMSTDLLKNKCAYIKPGSSLKFSAQVLWLKFQLFYEEEGGLLWPLKISTIADSAPYIRQIGQRK